MDTPSTHGDAPSPAAPSPAIPSPAIPSAPPLDRRFLLGGLAGAAGIAALTAMNRAASAGPLDPPEGPIAPTARIEPRTPVPAVPFTISTPGSYYLTGNIAAGVGEAGITVSASNVTIDLNGFTITDGGIFQGGDGILITAGAKNITITNGKIRGTSTGGIRATGGNGAGDDVTIDRVRIDAVGAEWGIAVGNRAVVTNVTVTNCTSGIAAGSASRISDCVVEGTSLQGYAVGNGSRLERCSARAIGGVEPSETAKHGFVTGPDCTIIGCAAAGIAAHAYSLGPYNTIADSTAADVAGDYGIAMNTGCTAVRCTVRGRGSQPGPAVAGISIGTRCGVSQCRVVDFQGISGIVIGGDDSSMEDCCCFGNGTSVGLTVNAIQNWSVVRCTFEGMVGPGVAVLTGAAGGELRHCTIRNASSDSASPGLLLRGHWNAVQHNTLINQNLNFSGRAVTYDQIYSTITNNTFIGYGQAILTPGGQAPNPGLNIIGPIITAANIATAPAWGNTFQ